MSGATGLAEHVPPRPQGARIGVLLTQLTCGGAEGQTVDLLERLRHTDWEPHVVVSLSEEVDPYGPVIRNFGYRLEVLPRSSSLDPIRLTRLRALIRRERLDLVHAVHLHASGYVWLATLPGRRPVLLPTFRSGRVPKGLLRLWIFRLMVSNSRAVLTNSHKGAECLRSYFGGARSLFEVISNGKDFEELRRRAFPPQLRRELGISSSAPLIGYVGKDAPAKNLPLFLEVARRLLGREPSAHIVLAGAGLDEAVRAKLAPDLPRDQVHFLGRRLDLPALLADLDVLVMTSRSEGCPNAVLEALGVGTPVLSSDAGDVGRMIREGVSGRIVKGARADDFLDPLQDILARRGEYRQGARSTWPELQTSFGLDSMVAGTIRLWNRLLTQAQIEENA